MPEYKDYTEGLSDSVYAWRQPDGSWHVYNRVRKEGCLVPRRIAIVVGSRAIARSVCFALEGRRIPKECALDSFDWMDKRP